jgi:ATP-dependent Lon protease
LKTILIPKKNEKDMVEIPRKVKRDLNFVFVEKMEEVLPVALSQKPSKGRASSRQRARASGKG